MGLVFLTSDEKEQNIDDNKKFFPQIFLYVFIFTVQKSKQQIHFREKKTSRFVNSSLVFLTSDEQEQNK